MTNPMYQALLDNYEEYMKNEDVEGFFSDMSLLLQCHVDDEDDVAETLLDNLREMRETNN